MRELFVNVSIKTFASNLHAILLKSQHNEYSNSHVTIRNQNLMPYDPDCSALFEDWTSDNLIA